MHKVVSFNTFAMTRNIMLKNLSTGTIDVCFDYSSGGCDGKFEFMKESYVYNCKIMLFGVVMQECLNDNVVQCRVVNSNIRIGCQTLIKVLINQDLYYISKNEFGQLEIPNIIYFDLGRKDLIEVDGVIHNDLLHYS